MSETERVVQPSAQWWQKFMRGEVSMPRAFSETFEAKCKSLVQRLDFTVRLNMADKETNWQQLMEQRRELSSLEKQVAQARDQWEQTKTFMAAQGLRQDAPDFPILGQKTLAAASTTVEVADFE